MPCLAALATMKGVETEESPFQHLHSCALREHVNWACHNKSVIFSRRALALILKWRVRQLESLHERVPMAAMLSLRNLTLNRNPKPKTQPRHVLSNISPKYPLSG